MDALCGTQEIGNHGKTVVGDVIPRKVERGEAVAVLKKEQQMTQPLVINGVVAKTEGEERLRLRDPAESGHVTVTEARNDSLPSFGRGVVQHECG